MSYSFLDADVWERLPAETDKAWLAFQLYRDLPLEVRSLKRAAQMYYERLNLPWDDDSDAKHITTWARTHNWQYRVRAWDAYVDQQARTAYVQKRVEAAERQAELGRSLTDIGQIGFESKLERHNDEEDTYNLGYEKIRDLAQLIDTGIKLERTAMGEPIHIEAREYRHEIAGSRSDDGGRHKGLRVLDVEELRKLRRLNKKVIGELPESTETDIVEGEIVEEEDE